MITILQGRRNFMARVDRDRRYLSWKLMIILAVLMLILFSAAMIWVNKDIQALQSTAEDKRQEAMNKSAELEELNLELLRMGTEGYVENEAREKLDFIREGEIVFAFENPDALKGYTLEEYQIIMDEMRD